MIAATFFAGTDEFRLRVESEYSKAVRTMLLSQEFFKTFKMRFKPSGAVMLRTAGAYPTKRMRPLMRHAEEQTMKITVETKVASTIEQAWSAWNTPDDIKQWNAASEDWHTTKSDVDLREGGAFSSRMEAKDGSMGFDFAGTYTRVVEHQLIESTFGGRTLVVEFIAEHDGVVVRETFDAETTHSVDQQRGGWQAILDRFKKHVEAAR